MRADPQWARAERGVVFLHRVQQKTASTDSGVVLARLVACPPCGPLEWRYFSLLSFSLFLP